MSQIKRHIAIIGAGFSGLATAWHLSQLGHQVTLYESSPLGKNASGISAGLLHLYTGYKATRAKNGDKRLELALELLKVSSSTLGKPVYQQTGLLRPALKENQAAFFKACADQNSDVYWMKTDEVQKKFPGIHPLDAIWIESAFQVDTHRYLEGLWKACQANGVEWIRKKITSANELTEDLRIIATGASPFPEISQLPIHQVKGQLLELTWYHPLPFPISSGVYLVKGSKPNSIYLGATFEHEFSNTTENVDVARERLLPKLNKLYPLPDQCEVLSCKSALRASTPTREPFVEQVDSKTWAIVGMGSKGILYHAEAAKRLLQAIAL